MEILDRIRETIHQAVIGKDDVIDCLLIAVLCGGHVLMEDAPGLGKTTLARTLAASLGCSFRRVQFTPDLLPADLTGYTLPDLQGGKDTVRFGAVMTQVLLADEINRASPKTQSALLEVMQEGQVTIDGTGYPLPKPFLVLATQNPVEMTGTYPLPEAQLDRFLMKLSLNYPEKREELDILRQGREKGNDPVAGLTAAAGPEEILALQEAARKVLCAPPVLDYIVNIARRSRESREISLGVSPRGSLALMNASAARALLEGRDYVIPEDVQKLAVPVLAHRILLDTRADIHGRSAAAVIEEILHSLPVPGTGAAG